MTTALALGQKGAGLLNTYGWFLLVAGDYQQALEVTADALSLTENRTARAA